MTNNLNTPPRLPDELIAEIFRNKTLSCRDLFHCSLVSRNFVDSVNRSLYQHILVELDVDVIGEEYENDDLNTHDYTTRSWKLLRTLLDHPRLAEYVKELEFGFGFDRDDERGSRRTGNETKKPLALSTFLRLASNAKNVIFDGSWALSRATLAIVQKYEKVTGLGVTYMEEQTEEYCARHLSHLSRLSIILLTLDRTDRNEKNTLSWTSLHRLELCGGVDTITEFPSFAASSSTLRNLLVPLNLALHLDYSQFPMLRELQLVRNNFGDSYGGGRDCHSSATTFWKSLCKSPSLHTLTFDTEQGEFSQGYEQALFEYPGVPETPIPSLRILRFENDVRLQRAHSLLSGLLASTLQQVVVPSFFAEPGADLAKTNKLGAVAFWCEARGIKLVLADRPWVLRTLLCTPISLTRISMFQI